MHARRLASFFLGIWLGASILLTVIVSQNLEQVDRVLADASPAARLELKALGPNARSLLRYQASEDNRTYLRYWTLAQIGIGTAFLLIMLFGSHEHATVLVGLLVMVVLSAVQSAFLLPEMEALGRMNDFLPLDQGMPERNRFWILQTAYYGAEGVKWLIAAGLAAGMIFSRRRSGRSRDSRRDFDMVDKSNYRRVDR